MPDAIVYETITCKTCRAMRNKVIPFLKKEGYDIEEELVNSSNSRERIRWYKEFCDRNIGKRIVPIGRVGDNGVVDRRTRKTARKSAEVLGRLIREEIEEQKGEPPKPTYLQAIQMTEEGMSGIYRE